MQVARELLNREFECICGKKHFIPIEEVVVSDDMIDELKSYLINKNYQNVLLVADENTYAVIGEEIFKTLQGNFMISELVFPGHPRLEPEEKAVRRIQIEIQKSSAQAVLAIGNGVINDIVRYASFEEGIPYVSIPTAPSVDGYASNLAPILVEGFKVTKVAQTPEAIFASPSVMARAPWGLIQSGFGDLVGKLIALLDWKLAHALYGEYFCPATYKAVQEPLKYCINHAELLANRDSQAIRTLFIGLVNSGIAIAMVGHSRPASASEHHCSHFMDYLTHQNRKEPSAHGLQVAYATHWMIDIYRKLKELDEIKEPVSFTLTEEWEKYAKSYYGFAAEDVIAQQKKKQDWLANNRVYWKMHTPNICTLLGILEPEISMLDEAKESLIEVGIPYGLGYIGIDKELMWETLVHANEMRARYTILDFLAGQNLKKKVINDVVDNFAE